MYILINELNKIMEKIIFIMKFELLLYEIVIN